MLPNEGKYGQIMASMANEGRFSKVRVNNDTYSSIYRHI